jgi:pyruvate,orthophosphate dikinase
MPNNEKWISLEMNPKQIEDKLKAAYSPMVSLDFSDAELKATAAAIDKLAKAAQPAKKAMEDCTMTLKDFADQIKELPAHWGMDLASGKDMMTVGYGTTFADKVMHISGPQPDTGDLVLKMLKEHNSPKENKYQINWDFSHTPLFDKPEEPDKMAANPKKGQTVNEFKTYRFGAENTAYGQPREVLGGKGHGLAEMVSLGIPVPAGFVIPCDASVQFDAGWGEDALNMAMGHAAKDEDYLHKQFGYYPLVSVRSGARVSMPGMMDTILNVGIHEGNLDEWKARIGDRGALDSYRRFLQMYGTTALGIEEHYFEDALADIKKSAKVDKDSALSADFLSRLVKRYKDIYNKEGKTVPATRAEALRGAVRAVFESWNNQRAKDYREANGIPHEWGTAVVVQAMVFGNMDEQSGSGVAFTRDYATGENKPIGNFLPMGQGEDVVAAKQSALPLEAMKDWNLKAYNQLVDVMNKLEAHYRDMQDLEFTVQHDHLYLLQTRTGKRQSLAAFKIAHDMVKQGLINRDEALKRLTKADMVKVMSPQIDPKFNGVPIATGLGTGVGVASGLAVFNPQTAVDLAKAGEKVILIRHETDPSDYLGMKAAVGILTATGDITSHAAVVANGMSKVCVVGCKTMIVGGSSCTFDKKVPLNEGDLVSIDGATGRVWKGLVPVIEPTITDEVQAVARWLMGKEMAYRITPSHPTECGLALKNLPEGTEVAYIDTCLMPDDMELWVLG